jgi:Zn-dependent protease
LSEFTPERIAWGITSYVVLLFSLSFHEAAHAWMARRLGDHTAEHEGRVSLNPIVHIDPIGTVLLPLIQFVASGIPLFAWAKPTPYVPANFNRDTPVRRGHVLVAGVGPLSNLLLALIFAIFLLVAGQTGLLETSQTTFMILAVGIQMNVALAIFNLIPLPPLDGSKVASFGLPPGLADSYDRVAQPYGQWILLGLFVSGALSYVLSPILDVVMLIVRAIAL